MTKRWLISGLMDRCLAVRAALFVALFFFSSAPLAPSSVKSAFAGEPTCAHAPLAAAPAAAQVKFVDPGRLIASVQSGRYDAPRVELAARLADAGFAASDEYARMRENAARELAGRPDGIGVISAQEACKVDEAIDRQRQMLRGTLPLPSFAELARLPGRPQIEGLNVVYLHPLGDPARANGWKNIIVHQTEGPAGSARGGAAEQFAHPTRRGVMLWVETDGTVYWATAENAIPTHGDGANRNDNKYIDNAPTYHNVIKTNSIGVEFAGNFPDVAAPVTSAQERAWQLLVRFLQERYAIPAQNIFAHNWIDFKDRRYCEGCALATAARQIDYRPTTR